MTNEDKLRDQAAKPTLLRIQADVERASPRLKSLLGTVAIRLFERRFNVGSIWREHKIADKNAAAVFREIGTTPSAYILRGRMETAERLLAQTLLQMRRISQMVGYSDPRSFRRAFQRWRGSTPAECRRRQGDSRSDRLEGALARIRRLYDPDFELLEPRLLTGRGLEEMQAKSLVVPRLAGLSFEDQRHAVQRARPFSTPALYDALHRISREAGRKDRQRGVELSQLALDSLEANALTLGSSYCALRPQAWAWLGNAHRLALDFLAAERAIEEAVGALGSTADPSATGIVYLVKGTLRTFQRRQDEAVELFDVALPAFDEAGDETWRIWSLIHRAAALGYAEEYQASLATLKEATALPGAKRQPFHLLLPYNIASTLVRLGRLEGAQEHLASLRRVQDLGDLEWRYKWLAANIDHDFGKVREAEEKYLSTAQILDTLDEPLYRSLLLLDLAVLYAEERRVADLIPICEMIYPIFQTLRLYEETLTSVLLLGQAIPEACVTADLLRALRASLRRDPLATEPKKV